MFVMLVFFGFLFCSRIVGDFAVHGGGIRCTPIFLLFWVTVILPFIEVEYVMDDKDTDDTDAGATLICADFGRYAVLFKPVLDAVGKGFTKKNEKLGLI